MPSRRTKRAATKSHPRSSYSRRQRRGVAFVAVMVAILLAGGAATALLRANPPDVHRGAIIGQHWHAPYQVEICGRPLAPYPFVDGEIHTHGDGVIHLHPQTQAFANDNANLGAFFASVESLLGRNPDGTQFLILPDGTRYEHGGSCEALDGPQELVVLVNGEAIDEGPDYLPQEGDDVIVRFGPQAPIGTEPIPNPLPVGHGAAPAEAGPQG